MKEQYVGDINDYRKYALLRALSAGGRHRIGVCWMLTPSDGSNDGNLLAYLKKPEPYRRHDPELFDLLHRLAGDFSTRRLIEIETSGVIEGATYFNAETPQEPGARATYMEACQTAFADRDLVFFDPDNGLAVPSTRKGLKNSPKYVFLDELAPVYAAGKSVLVYQHYPRVERAAFAQACAAQLRTFAPDAEIWRFGTSNVLFLLVVNPKTSGDLSSAAQGVASRFATEFMTASLISMQQTNN